MASVSDAGGTHSSEAYEMAEMAFILDGIHMAPPAPPVTLPQRADDVPRASMTFAAGRARVGPGQRQRMLEALLMAAQYAG